MYLDSRFIDNLTFKNLLINGDFRVAQRGTSGTNVGNRSYLLDRWYYTNASNTVLIDWNRGFNSEYGYYLHMEVSQEDTDPNVKMSISQWNDWSNLYYGKTLTMSCWIKTNITELYWKPLIKDTSDSMHVLDEIPISVPLDTWVKIHATITLPSTLSYTPKFISLFRLNTPETLNGKYIDIAMAQTEFCTKPSPFEIIPYDVQLYRCKRYYEKIYDIKGFMTGSENDIVGVVEFMEKRRIPDIVVYAPSDNTPWKADVYYYDGTSLQSDQIDVQLRHITNQSFAIVNFDYTPPVNNNVRFLVNAEIDADYYP